MDRADVGLLGQTRRRLRTSRRRHVFDVRVHRFTVPFTAGRVLRDPHLISLRGFTRPAPLPAARPRCRSLLMALSSGAVPWRSTPYIATPLPAISPRITPFSRSVPSDDLSK